MLCTIRARLRSRKSHRTHHRRHKNAAPCLSHHLQCCGHLCPARWHQRQGTRGARRRSRCRADCKLSRAEVYFRQENAAPRRHRRVDCTQATWVGLASSGFILLPAGRDIVAEGTAILPGDEELISALSIANPDAKRWFWGMWGLNHCFLSILKLQAINQKVWSGA